MNKLMSISLSCLTLALAVWLLLDMFKRHQAPPLLNISAALSVEEDLSEAAGLGKTDHTLITFLQGLNISIRDQAVLKFRLCGLVWAEDGPAKALLHCEQSLQQDPQPRTQIRISRLYSEMNQSDKAMAALQGLPEPQEPVPAALWGWAWGHAHMANLRPSAALTAFQRVSQVLPQGSEYQAIAELEIAKAYLKIGNYGDGYDHLNRAIQRQRTLMTDSDKGGYSEYQLYLARMLILHPDHEAEGRALFKALQAVDPQRYEYKENR